MRMACSPGASLIRVQHKLHPEDPTTAEQGEQTRFRGTDFGGALEDHDQDSTSGQGQGQKR